MATIEKRGEMWYSNFQHLKRRYHEPLDQNEGAAWKKLRELVAVVKAGSGPALAAGAGWSQFKDEYFRRQESTKSPRTLRTEAAALAQLEDFHHLSRTNDLTTEILDNFRLARHKAGAGVQGINRNVRAIKTVMRWAARNGMAPDRDWRSVPYFKEPAGTTDFLTVEELQQLIKVASRHPHHLTLVMLTARLGLRASEAYWLKWENCDFRLGRVNIVSKPGFTPKSNKPRFVSMPDEMPAFLKAVKAKSKSEYVISDATGWRPATPEAMGAEFKKQVMHKARLRKRLHILRHTFASHYVMGGGDMPFLSALMGHSKQKTTERYAHIAQSSLDASMSVMPKIKPPGFPRG
jgi:site-specific recombinase XerD